MHLEHLALTDFRSYAAADLPLGPGVTVVLGANGNGKTNLLEAVVYLSGLASHRVAGDQPLVRSGAQRAVVRARVRRGERVATTDVEISPGSAVRVQVNRAAVARPRRSAPLVRAVVFAPEDLAVVRGDPERRRRFLDDVVVARSPRLAGVRADYDRIVRQRTALLKSLRQAAPAARAGAAAALDVWDEQLAQVGADLLQARVQTVEELRPHAGRAYDEVSGARGPAGVAYAARGLGDHAAALTAAVEATRDGEDLRESLRGALLAEAGRRRAEEADRGACLVGPHRDDVDLSIRGMPARSHASHGEAWSLALALRLASLELLDDPADRTLQPVLVLDDVLAELDADRRRHLAARAARVEQVLVSVAAVADVPAELADVAATVLVSRDADTGLSSLTALDPQDVRGRQAEGGSRA